MAVAARLGLLDEAQRRPPARPPRARTPPVARADDHADLLDPGAQHLLEDDAQHGLARAVTVHERLQRQVPLVPPSGGDHGLGDLHGRRPPERVQTLPETSVVRNRIGARRRAATGAAAQTSCGRRALPLLLGALAR